jgi:DNA polymerase-3 subunit delta
VEEAVASSAERRAWTLADGVVARDPASALRTYLALRAQGERLPGLLYWMAQRLRLALNVAERLRAGESEAAVRKSLRMPSKAAERLIADVRESDPDRVRAALETLARLEVDSRGGVWLEEDTISLVALEDMAA